MLRLYRLQSKRLGLLSRYRAVVTHSEHLKAEYINHGLDPARVFNLSYYAHKGKRGSDGDAPTPGAVDLSPVEAEGFAEGDGPGDTNGPERTFQLLFLGRMDRLKGGRLLLDTLPAVQASLGKPLRVVLAGDGPDRRAWERRARALQARHVGVEIKFAGWLQGAELESLWAGCDLLVVPSQWPEPFGLVGVEAGSRGVPAAAFAVGGIPTWLSDGVNGYLAPGDPPTSAGLAEAVVKCLKDPLVHARLRRGAVEKARQFNLGAHLFALNEVFEHVLKERTSG